MADESYMSPSFQVCDPNPCTDDSCCPGGSGPGGGGAGGEGGGGGGGGGGAGGGGGGGNGGGPSGPDPIEHPGISSGPVVYATGTIIMTEVDLDANLSGFRHARVWRNSTVNNSNYNGPNGFNWDIEEWPYLVKRQLGSKVTINARIGSLQLRIDLVGSDYIVRHNQKDYYSFTHDATTHLYTLTHKQAGAIETIQFYDFDQSANPTGAMWKRVDENGYVTQVTSYTANGNINGLVSARGASVFELAYEYIASGISANRFATVTLNKLDQYPSPTLVTPLRRTRYTYYDGTNSLGNLNDLEAAILQQPTGNIAPNDWEDIAVSYYRYYTGDVGIAYQHGLQYVVNPATYAELTAAGQDPLAGPPSGTDLVPNFADHYFEYEFISTGRDGVRTHRVSKEIARGCAGCGGNGGTSNTGQTFTRSNNPNYPSQKVANSNYLYNTWLTKAVSQDSGGYQTVTYSNRVNQVMLQVIQELNTSGAVRQWCTYFQYDDSGRLVMQASPSAVLGFNESEPDLVGNHGDGNYTYLRNDDGLISLTTYYETTTATAIMVGGVSGWREYTKIQQGSQGAEIKTSYTQYIASDNTSGAVAYVVGQSTIYPDDTNQDATAITTSYSYQWYAPSGDAPAMVKQKITTLPAVPTEQNGTGVATTTQEYFDSTGNLIWKMDERGIIAGMSYDLERGLLVQSTADVSSVPTPPGWPVTSGGHLNLITDYEYDDLGRPTLTLGRVHPVEIAGVAQNVRTVAYTLYVQSPLSVQPLNEPPVGDQTRTAQGYATGTVGSYSFFVSNPVTIVFADKLGRVLDQVISKRSGGSGALNASDVFLRADWSRWSFMSYTKKAQLEYQRDYYDIPLQSPDLGLGGISQDPGVAGTNYYETFYGYDGQANTQIRVKKTNGTIVRTVYDSIDRSVARYVGINDIPTGGTWENWTPGAMGTDLVQITAIQYDNNNAGGMSNITMIAQFVSANTQRQTAYQYDYRSRQIVMDGEETQYIINTFDNLNRVIQTDQRDSTSSGRLVGRSQKLFDTLERVYQTKQYGVDPSTGNVGNAIVGNNTYDAAGNLVKAIAPGEGVKANYTFYDNLNRITSTQIGYDDSSATSGRVVAEATLTQYDEADNTLTTIFQQLDVGATATAQTFRSSYRFFWYDGIGRQTGAANYGSGATPPTRPDITPAASDTELVNLISYDDAGEIFETTDPLGRAEHKLYDDLGRVITRIENYSGTGVPATPNADDNRTTLTSYTPNGQIAVLTAVMMSSTDDQITTYIYGSVIPDGSDIASNDLLREIVYPDGTAGSDSVTMSYNRQSQVTFKTDQAGTKHEYQYDGLGRLRHDIIRAFGSGIDKTVKRITTQYEVRGMPATLSSCMTAQPNGSGTGGGVTNQVASSYNIFGQPIKDSQSHNGAITDSTPYVLYGYSDGTDNDIRPISTTYPNGRTLSLTYDSNPLSNGLQRVDAAGDTLPHLVSYGYLGISRQVSRNYDNIEISLDLVGNTLGIYSGLDRFDRVINQNWSGPAPGILSQNLYGYDRNSNRLYRADPAAQALGKHFDELYAYDGLNRLTDMKRGLLNSTNTGIQAGTQSFEQSWNLDPVGNWKIFSEDATGGGTFTLVQQRSNNLANEIQTITESVGPTWATPSYDPAGNTVAFPQGGDPTQQFTARYDAWNRLISVIYASNDKFAAQYVYDARNYRITRILYNASGAYQNTLEDYFSNRWQVLETRKWSSHDPTIPPTVYEQYTWGQSTGGYVDELAFRDRDSDGDETLDERVYAMQDANFNVVAVTSDVEGEVDERYVYTPYGKQVILDETYSIITPSIYEWTCSYQGLFASLDSVLLDNRNRVIHTMIGRFLQRDPLDYIDGASLYEYVQSNPPARQDPLGLDSNTCDAPPKPPNCNKNSGCCECMLYQESASDTGCMAAIYSVAVNRQNADRKKFPGTRGESGFCAQARSKAWAKDNTRPQYKKCCKGANDDSGAQAHSVCTTPPATDPTGGAQYYFPSLDAAKRNFPAGVAACQQVNVPGCSGVFLKCDKDPGLP